MASFYLNLPVADLAKATAFYEALGFTKHADYSNDDGSGMVYDAQLSVMLLTHAFAKSFLPATKQIGDAHTSCAGLYALQLESKEAVDAFFATAVRAGAKQTIPPYDHGFMYGKDFEDLDGHIWEVFRMQSPETEI